jgi:hypothetical protein
MRLTDDASEIEFEARIDGKFPYSDPVSSASLIQEAAGISLNASCCVLDEICRPPQAGLVTSDRQRELIEQWAYSFDHELKGSLLACATALINNKPLDWQHAVQVMKRIGRFEGQRAALSVAYFAGDCNSAAGDAELTAARKQITAAWEERGV